MSFNFMMNDDTSTLNTMYSKIGEDFCKVYYHKMTEGGFSQVMNFFHKEARCTLDNQEYNGCYDILVKLAQMGVHRFIYKKISGTSQPFGNSILISVVGDIIPVSFQKHNGKHMKFSECFILKNISGNYFVTNHILKLLK